VRPTVIWSTDPMYDFSQQVAVVTGAAAGLGKAIATRLAADGATVALVDLDEAGLKATVEELAATGAKVLAITANVGSADDVERVVKTTEADLGPISLLVNNAGIAVIKPYMQSTDEDFDRQISVNLRGTHLFLSRILPGMVERRRGAVVNISSVAAIHVTAPHAGYAASKAGIIALTQEVAFEVARHGVRVNCVAPGLIAVPPSATKQPYLQEQAGSARRVTTPTTTRPLGFGQPEDIANAVAFLLSDQARFIIGQTLKVAGGTDLQISMTYPGEPLS
jgi:NAD(P)-dependent dehydrogenase (short-subunit alcohol dehydrogenase family)